ncbi:MAG: hypothetical protein ACKOPO_06820 [Novosphingobium sp.]
MTAQLLLTALFVIAGLGACATLQACIVATLPKAKALRAQLAAGDPMVEVTWRVTTVDVCRQPAAVTVMPGLRPAMRKVSQARQQQPWLAAA